MSITAEALATCSNCGNQHRITIYKSINTSESPEIKEKVKDGSLFVWECPVCNQRNLARYECLYHDPRQKTMIWMLPDGDLPESQMSAILNHTKAMGNYILRKVDNIGSLIEKILIFDAGLEDTVIELCKFVTCLELKKNTIEIDQMHFYRISDKKESTRFITFIYPCEGQMQSINTGYNVYEDCSGILKRNPDIIPKEPFPSIDKKWIDSFVK